MKIDDVLEALPTQLAREPDATKREGILKTAARLKEVKNRKLLCDFHGIKVFEYRGKRSLELSEEVAARLQNLERQTPDSVREMVEDLTALSMAASFQAEVISPPPQPLYDEDGLVNGEAFHKAAAAIWARTAMHRGLWELLRTRLGAKLNRLRSSAGNTRLEHAAELKKEIAAAIDAIADQGNRKSHGSADLILWKLPDGTQKPVTLAWAALKMTCALIFVNCKPPTKGEVRKLIRAANPETTDKDSTWRDVWRDAGIKWLGRKGDW